MSPATLYREGTDLDELLAELDAQYPNRVRVVEIARPREGGVLGFFAKQRVGVHYMLTAEGEGGSAPTSPVSELAAENHAAVRDSHFQQILAELSRRQAAHVVDEGGDVGDDDEASPALPTSKAEPAIRPAHFEPITPAVVTLPAAAPVAEAAVSIAGETALPTVGETAMPTVGEASPRTTHSGSRTPAFTQAPASAPNPAPNSAPAFTQDPAPTPTPTRTRPARRAPDPRPLAVRRQLLELGVAVDRLPAIITDARTAIAELVESLPPPPQAPTVGGQILVVTGPAHDVVTAANLLTRGRGAPFDSAWSFECPPGPGQGDVVVPNRAITSVDQAAALARQWRARADRPVLVIVATDGPTWRQRAAKVIAGLKPDALWAVVDATRKPDDTRRALADLGRVDGIVVVNARHTSSPASVWSIDTPIALLGGRHSTPTAWTVLLESKLTELERECSADPF